MSSDPKNYFVFLFDEISERGPGGYIFDSRQSALTPQKQKSADRLLPFVTTSHPAVKKKLTKS